MSELQAGRLAQIRFAASQSPNGREMDGLSSLPNVQVVAQRQDELTLECSGDLQPLLQWLARQPVVDCRIQPLGLSPIYNRHHNNHP
jgi:hypothetical protein